ncbi:MAG: hypothetical protein IKX88_10395 [Thermoguttaceae bacterium]|nr:hypothetical protein [Thermoguttaceae bacterium]
MKRFTGRFFPFWIALASSILFCVALPPLHWKYAIFLAPLLWSVLASRRVERSESDAKKRGVLRRLGRAVSGEYSQIWFASFLFWLFTVVWVSYPHPITTVGWVVLSGYLAFYLPLYIGLCRAMNRMLRAPIWLASPICWVAIEWVRNRMLGGFSFAGLSHALYDVPMFIQIAEPLGEYGVGAAIVLIGALLGEAFTRRLNADGKGAERRAVRYVSLAAIVLLCVLIYGSSRLSYFDGLESDARDAGFPSLKIALLQDSTQYRFPPPKGLNKEVSDKYRALAFRAAREEGGYDLIVWPEGCYSGYFFDADDDYNALINSFDTIKVGSETLDASQIAEKYPKYAALEGAARLDAQDGLIFVRDKMISQRRGMLKMTAKLGATALLGTASAVFDQAGVPTTHNAAVIVPYVGDETLVDQIDPAELTQAPTSSLVNEDSLAFRRYDKIHLVLFGEYIPFLKYLPDSWEIKAVCAENVLGRGRGPSAFRVSPRESAARFILAPNICFESSIPHMIKAQIQEYKAADADPDVLVNVSHDGWFRCGKETDMHLATHVYRAIENRRSVISATHGGFSAWIDPAGRIRAKGTRGASEVVGVDLVSVKGERHGRYGNVDLAETWSLCCACLAFFIWIVALSYDSAKKRIDRKRREDSLTPKQGDA